MNRSASLVADVLEHAGMSKSDISRRSGVSRALLDDYLKYRRQPSLAQIERLADAAGLRLDIRVRPAIADSPSWAKPRETMDAKPTTIAERAALLERVVPVALQLRRRPRGDLEFPLWRTLAGSP